MIITGSPQLKEVVKNQEYNIEYGTLKRGDGTQINVKITDVEHLSISKTCGCTSPSVESKADEIQISISYDSQKIGAINQRVTEMCADKSGSQRTIIFNLKGNITE
jgi:hypothetical protein